MQNKDTYVHTEISTSEEEYQNSIFINFVNWTD